jgi:capsular polysaccharide transport system ATP-binding protein
MIKVRGLTKTYTYNGKKATVLNNIDFDINSGESIAILGANGAGKSTLLRILGGTDVPDSGVIESDVSISWPVGLVGGFQGSLTGRENVTFVSRIYSPKYRINERIRYIEEFAEIVVEINGRLLKPFKLHYLLFHTADDLR